MNAVMREAPRDLDPGDHLPPGFYRYRCFEITPPRFADPPGIIGARLGARETGGINGGTGDHLPCRIEEMDHLSQDHIEIWRSDAAHELVQ